MRYAEPKQRNIPRHPEACIRPQSLTQRTPDYRASQRAEVEFMIKRRPRTPAEVREGYKGLRNFMEFFGGDRKLAAKSCGVSASLINRCIKLGYVTPYLAIAAQQVDELIWTEAGLAPYIVYDEDWDAARSQFANIQKTAKLFSVNMKKVYENRNRKKGFSKKKGPG